MARLGRSPDSRSDPDGAIAAALAAAKQTSNFREANMQFGFSSRTVDVINKLYFKGMKKQPATLDRSTAAPASPASALPAAAAEPRRSSRQR